MVRGGSMAGVMDGGSVEVIWPGGQADIDHVRAALTGLSLTARAQSGDRQHVEACVNCLPPYLQQTLWRNNHSAAGNWSTGCYTKA